MKLLLQTFDKIQNNVNIVVKVSSLENFWIKRLFDGNSHDWKLLPLHITQKLLEKILYFILTYK